MSLKRESLRAIWEQESDIRIDMLENSVFSDEDFFESLNGHVRNLLSDKYDQDYEMAALAVRDAFDFAHKNKKAVTAKDWLEYLNLLLECGTTFIENQGAGIIPAFKKVLDEKNKQEIQESLGGVVLEGRTLFAIGRYTKLWVMAGVPLDIKICVQLPNSKPFIECVPLDLLSKGRDVFADIRFKSLKNEVQVGFVEAFLDCATISSTVDLVELGSVFLNYLKNVDDALRKSLIKTFIQTVAGCSYKESSRFCTNFLKQISKSEFPSVESLSEKIDDDFSLYAFLKLYLKPTEDIESFVLSHKDAFKSELSKSKYGVSFMEASLLEKEELEDRSVLWMSGYIQEITKKQTSLFDTSIEKHRVPGDHLYQQIEQTENVIGALLRITKRIPVSQIPMGKLFLFDDFTLKEDIDKDNSEVLFFAAISRITQSKDRFEYYQSIAFESFLNLSDRDRAINDAQVQLNGHPIFEKVVPVLQALNDQKKLKDGVELAIRVRKTQAL